MEVDTRELQAFRPRIWNWARAFRNRLHRGQSPLAAVMRELAMRAGAKAPNPIPDDMYCKIDYKDADLLDQCALKLSRERLDILRIEYLDTHSTLDYETDSDCRRAMRSRARAMGLKSSRYWKEFLLDAENALMLRVHAVECCQGLDGLDNAD
jgi:hypothetical protein